jgi:hypothetical protein
MTAALVALHRVDQPETFVVAQGGLGEAGLPYDLLNGQVSLEFARRRHDPNYAEL